VTARSAAAVISAALLLCLGGHVGYVRVAA
jgi:hypothetical protein